MGRRLELLGFGNALVDIEFSVTDSELAATGLRKSGMTLADRQRQQHLFRTLLAKHPGRQSSGGSAANTIVAYAQFGGIAGYISALGQDNEAEFYSAEFERFGIALFAERLPTEPTGTCLVLITPDGERTMQTYLGASDCFERSMFDPRWLDSTQWLYLEGYKLTSSAGADAVFEMVHQARRRGVQVALSMSDVFVVTTCRDMLAELLPQIDMLFCNDREGRAYVGTDDRKEAFLALSAAVPNLAFTLGPDGSILSVGGQVVRIPAYPVKVLDTNGAGDMYAGALLYGLLHGWGIERSGHAASRAAAQIVAQYGARYHGDHRQLIERVEAVQRDGEEPTLLAGYTEPNDASNSPS